MLSSPLGEIDADEAVVGLMARHIVTRGELPIFYYGQTYLGSLEALTAAPLFAVFGPSTPLLKLVPTVYSLGFLVLSVLLARRVFGEGPALATGVYLAVPPAMWAIWSTRARGGYAELLFLGEVLLVLSLLLARPRPAPWLAGAWGVVAGVALWTHLLAIVYIVPAAVYLVVRRRRDWRLADAALLFGGALVGAAPLLAFNLSHDWRTVTDLLGRTDDVPIDRPQQVLRFLRVGLPVLAGAGVPVPPSDRVFFDREWVQTFASPVPIAVLVNLLLLAVVIVNWRASALPLLVLSGVVPALVTLTSYGYFASEPRYALPLYSAVPLLAAALWRLPLVVRGLVGGALLALHARTYLLAIALLWPPGFIQSDASTRGELIRFLQSTGHTHIHTDYWLAQPIMFESGETVLADAVDGAGNRDQSLADPVLADPGAAWVFESGSEAEGEFLRHSDTLGASGVTRVAIYTVYAPTLPSTR